MAKQGKKKTLIIIGVILIAVIITYLVYKNGNKTAETKTVELSARVKQLVDRVPWATREKIVGLYSWYEKNGDTLEIRQGKVFNVTKNKLDEYGRTSIERYRLDGVLWDVKTNYLLIDGATEWWLGHTMAFSLSEFQQSLSVK